MVCRQDEEEEEGSGLVSMQGERSFFGGFFLLNLRQETECLVGRDGGRWESGEDRN